MANISTDTIATYDAVETVMGNDFDTSNMSKDDQNDRLESFASQSQEANEEALQHLVIQQGEATLHQRNNWSKRILACIIGWLLFSGVFIVLVGIGKLTFTQETIVPAFMAQSVLNILGLGVIITKFLFNKDSMVGE